MLTELLAFTKIGKLPVDAYQLAGVHPFIKVHQQRWCSITYINFRSGINSSRKSCNWNRKYFVGSIALTEVSVMAYWRTKRIVNVRFDEARFPRLCINVPRNDQLLISCDAGLFKPTHSGTIEIRFQIDDAEGFLQKLMALNIIA